MNKSVHKVYIILLPNPYPPPCPIPIQAAVDGADTRQYDVFDYAELCYKYDGKGKELAAELVWSEETVTRYKNVKEKLHPLVWKLTRNPDLVNGKNEPLVNLELTKVNFVERHFRSLIANLPYTDNISYRFQLKLIRDAIDRFIKNDPRKRVTAKWIENEAIRYGWYAELAKYMRDHLVKEVPLQDRKNLLRQIYANAFGEKPDDELREKFQRAISTINFCLNRRQNKQWNLTVCQTWYILSLVFCISNGGNND